MQKFISDISNNEFPIKEKVSAKTIPHSIIDFIKNEYPNFNENSSITSNEIKTFNDRYISDLLVNEIGELTELEKKVLNSLKENKTLSTDDDDNSKAKLTFGQKLADKVASFGGSWTFIMSFGLFMLIWISLNVIIFTNKEFDPYPFILLNLILSCLAALQAPIIMMSQNRQEEKDRERAKKDYMINLKSELEIRILHEKLDHLIYHQLQEVLVEKKDILINK